MDSTFYKIKPVSMKLIQQLTYYITICFLNIDFCIMLGIKKLNSYSVLSLGKFKIIWNQIKIKIVMEFKIVYTFNIIYNNVCN